MDDAPAGIPKETEPYTLVGPFGLPILCFLTENEAKNISRALAEGKSIQVKEYVRTGLKEVAPIGTTYLQYPKSDGWCLRAGVRVAPPGAQQPDARGIIPAAAVPPGVRQQLQI